MFQSAESVCRPEMNSAIEKLSIIIIIIRPMAAMADSSQTTSAPSVAEPNLAEFGGRCRKAIFGVCLGPSVSCSLS